MIFVATLFGVLTDPIALVVLLAAALISRKWWSILAGVALLLALRLGLEASSGLRPSPPVYVISAALAHFAVGMSFWGIRRVWRRGR